MAEPVVKSLRMKLRQIVIHAVEYLTLLFCCCLNRKRMHGLNNKLENLAKGDREINKGLRTI
jgi:hypothetical protein